MQGSLLRRSIRAGLNGLLPEHVWRPIRKELPVTLRRLTTARRTRKQLQSVRGARVNIGCGGKPLQHWINIDIYSAPHVTFWDCRRGLPFLDDSVATIYSEHMFEHLDLDDEAKPFLRECHRCLVKGGVLRLVVPDAELYLRAYGGPWEKLAAIRPLDPAEEGWRDRWLDESYRTQIQLINAVFRQGNQHKYAYDRETLVFMLREAGFARIVPQSFCVSLDSKMAPDTEARRGESLYIEAVK